MSCLETCCFECQHHATCEMIGQCALKKPHKWECSAAKERSRCLKFDHISRMGKMVGPESSAEKTGEEKGRKK